MLASIVNLNAPDDYIHWGFILISMANFLVVVAMLVLFVLALTLPFVHSRRRQRRPPAPSIEPPQPPGGPPGSPPRPLASANATTSSPGDASLWTTKLRRLWMARLPPEKLLPDSQPAYVASWIYVFGVLTLAGFAVACLSGLVLALEGPIWWHTSTVGHFVNSLHLWSVECFMGFMAIHLWGKFWMASWRGKRALTWMTGAVAFLVSVFEAFTGYLSQTNFDSQWIAFEAKDAMNGAGIGAFFNTMNFGQALMLHIVLVPLVLAAIIALHIVMVRLRGVVHPIDANPEHLAPVPGSTAAVPAPVGPSAATHAMATVGPPLAPKPTAPGSAPAPSSAPAPARPTTSADPAVLAVLAHGATSAHGLAPPGPGRSAMPPQGPNSSATSQPRAGGRP